MKRLFIKGMLLFLTGVSIFVYAVSPLSNNNDFTLINAIFVFIGIVMIICGGVVLDKAENEEI